MPGKKWTTLDQQAFLESHIPAFLKCQSERQLIDFYSAVSRQFFTQWSECQLRFPLTAPDEALSKEGQSELTGFITRRKDVCLSPFLDIQLVLTLL